MENLDAKLFALYKEGLTDSEIAQQMHTSTSTVWHWRQERELPTHGSVHRQHWQTQAQTLYANGKNDTEIASALSVSKNSVWRWRQEQGLPAQGRRGPKPSKVQKPKEPKAEPAWHAEARELYANGLNDKQIAEKVHVSSGAVAYWRHKQGLPPINIYQTEIPAWHKDAQGLYNQGWTDRQIAEAVSRSPESVRQWRMRNNLPRQNQRSDRLQITSALFGNVSFYEDEVITFPDGLLGFPQACHFILHTQPQTAPVVWLISTDSGGPELALLDPVLVDPRAELQDIPDKVQSVLQCTEASELQQYGILTVTPEIRHMSLNERTPVLIHFSARLGMEYPSPGLERRPVRRRVYRELVSADPADGNGFLVINRKVNETIEIGPDISLQIMETSVDGVRIGISAPRRTVVTRGEDLVTPRCETKRAARGINLSGLEEVMTDYRHRKAAEDF